MSGGEEERGSIAYTPTWVVAAVCIVIVAISLAVERLLHCLHTVFEKRQKPLLDALQKIKEELMILGFISLLLTVFQGGISKICVSERVHMYMLPCRFIKKVEAHNTERTGNFRKLSAFPIVDLPRRFLSEHAAAQSGYCSHKHKVPLFPVHALHDLHMFIFVLAVSHVIFCGLTVVLGSATVRKWKIWEDSITNEDLEHPHPQAFKEKATRELHNAFVKEHTRSFRKDSVILGWMHAFFKQFYGSVTKSDYLTLRHGFIMTHCKSNPKFNFYQYMVRALYDDFKQVVGINWYHWVFVTIFVLLNLSGWNTYFWIAIIPLILLLAVGTKMEHVIDELAHEIAEQSAVAMEEAALVVKPSDEHFWFKKPEIVLFLIHFIFFQNAFEIAFFFWIWVTYGFESCMMGGLEFIIPRLVIGVFIQFFYSYRVMSLYAIASQMGTSFKKVIFEEHVQAGLLRWAKKAKNNRELKATNNGESSSSVQTGSGARHIAMTEQNNEIRPDTS